MCEEFCSKVLERRLLKRVLGNETSDWFFHILNEFRETGCMPSEEPVNCAIHPFSNEYDSYHMDYLAHLMQASDANCGVVVAPWTLYLVFVSSLSRAANHSGSAFRKLFNTHRSTCVWDRETNSIDWNETKSRMQKKFQDLPDFFVSWSCHSAQWNKALVCSLLELSSSIHFVDIEYKLHRGCDEHGGENVIFKEFQTGASEGITHYIVQGTDKDWLLLADRAQAISNRLIEEKIPNIEIFFRRFSAYAKRISEQYHCREFWVDFFKKMDNGFTGHAFHFVRNYPGDKKIVRCVCEQECFPSYTNIRLENAETYIFYAGIIGSKYHPELQAYDPGCGVMQALVRRSKVPVDDEELQHEIEGMGDVLFRFFDSLQPDYLASRSLGYIPAGSLSPQDKELFIAEFLSHGGLSATMKLFERVKNHVPSIQTVGLFVDDIIETNHPLLWNDLFICQKSYSRQINLESIVKKMVDFIDSEDVSTEEVCDCKSRLDPELKQAIIEYLCRKKVFYEKYCFENIPSEIEKIDRILSRGVAW